MFFRLISNFFRRVISFSEKDTFKLKKIETICKTKIRNQSSFESYESKLVNYYQI